MYFSVMLQLGSVLSGPLAELGELKLCAQCTVLGLPSPIPGGPLRELGELKLCVQFSVIGFPSPIQGCSNRR